LNDKQAADTTTEISNFFISILRVLGGVNNELFCNSR